MNFFWHTLAVICMFIPGYLGYGLILGKGKILHFGHEGIVMVTGYTVFILLMQFHTGYILALFGGLIAIAAVSLLFALLALRLEADAFGVMSLAVHLMLFAVVLNWSSVTRGALGIPGLLRFPFLQTPFDFAMFGLVVAVFFFWLMWKVDRSAFGRKLAALAEHEWHAKSLGIYRRKVYILA
ncbi:hypothetical protein COU76_05720, partial [Candidatus Peregrinibacteria bacterium CG10_big_fil_rev_8_21_14_0_10_49_10]